jgi:hypothetical protein
MMIPLISHTHTHLRLLQSFPIASFELMVFISLYYYYGKLHILFLSFSRQIHIKLSLFASFMDDTANM